MKFKKIISIFINICFLSVQILSSASLEVDKSSNTPSLKKAPNGVPIVDIVKPNSSGLSHNKFKNYSVEKQGLILNNANKAVDTKLAGYIPHNPNLKGKSASLILNEITGTNRTLLKGYSEVAGASADVIVANPNGISVNGGGFINTPKATLTTGTPLLNSGKLLGFDVNGGDIGIEGEGFNANNIDKVALYTKALHLNAKLYADNLQVITGENSVNIDGTYTSKKTQGLGVSIDSTQLGGIYANKITLESSDKGVGVNMPPEVFATNTLHVNAKGDITLQKSVAGDTLYVKSQTSAINLKGDISSKSMQIEAEKDIHIKKDKVVTAQESFNFQSKQSLYNYGEISALEGFSQSSVNVVEDIFNEGLLEGYDLEVKAKNIDNKGAFYAKNRLKITGDTLNNHMMIRSNEDIELFIKNSFINQKEGMVYSDGNLRLQANINKDKKNSITNKGIIQAGKNIDISAKSFSNLADVPVVKNTTNTSTKTISRGGANDYDIVKTTTQTQEIDIPINPALLLADGNINLDVQTLNNFYSLIASDGDITLNADSANNVGKVIVAVTKTVTRKYRNEKYCSSSGPSGTCFNHKHRAGYRGTFTKTETTKLPLPNYGIQAKKNISGNVVTLNNLSDQLEGSLEDNEIKQRLDDIEVMETNAISLQRLNSLMASSNEKSLNTITNMQDVDLAIEEIDTKESLLEFKNDLELLEGSISQSLIQDKASLDSLEAIIGYMESIKSDENTFKEIVNIKNSIENLRANIIVNQEKIEQLKSINSSIENLDNVLENKESLKSLSVELKNSFVESSNELQLIKANGYVTLLATDLERSADTLRDEVNKALDLQDDIEYKILSKDEGQYQINSNHTLAHANPINSNANSQVIIDNITLPKEKYGLFLTNQASEHPYLVEANPLYTNFDTFISSDYMIEKLSHRPDKIMKRLGDAMYETQLVKNSIIRLSGNRYLEGYGSDLAQFKALMDNALALEEDLKLSFGVALTKEQIANLNKDIVWMEEKLVNGHKVLVPQVYLSTKSIDEFGVKVLAEDIDLHVKDTLLNNGTLKAKGKLGIEAKQITNINASLKSDGDMELQASKDINNFSGKIQSGGDLYIKADGEINSISLAQKNTNRYAQGIEHTTTIGDKAEIKSNKNISIETKKDINVKGGSIQAKENLSLVSTTQDVKVGAVESKSDYNFRLNNGYTKGKKSSVISSSITAKSVDIKAEELSLEASNIETDESVSISGVKNVELSGINEVEYQDSQIKTSSGFMGSQTKRDMKYKEKVVGSSIKAKNILINSKEESVTLEAANLKAKENILIEAKEDIKVLAKEYREGELHYRAKSSWGGLKQSASMDKSDVLKLKEARLKTEALNIILKSGDDIKILASNIDSAADTQLQATNEVLIAAAKEFSDKEKWSKSSSFNIGSLVASLATLGLVDFGPVYQSQYDLKANADSTAKSSSIKSGANVIIDAGSAKVVGSNIKAQENIIAKTDIGSIEVLAAKEHSNKKEIHERTEVKLASIVDVAKDISTMGGGESKLKITMAEASLDEIESTGSDVSHKSSNLVSSSGNIILDSTESINVEGSNVKADKGGVALHAEQNINIKETVDTKQTSSKEKHAKAEVSLTIQNEYVEAAKAYKEVVKATKQVREAKSDYKAYKNSIKEMQSRLEELKKEYTNRVPGIDKDDIDEFEELIEDIKSDEKYYLAAIAASVVNLTSKTTMALQQTSTAASSGGTYGFSAGISLDMQGSKTNTNTQATKSTASNLQAKNILIQTKKDRKNQTSVSGSNLIAKEDIVIDTNELNILSSSDTSTQKSNTKDISGSVSMTMYGAASGPQVSLGYGENHAQSDSLSNTNSQLQAKNITTTTTKDTNIKGAKVRAKELLAMVVGGDLNVESQRDIYNSNSKGFNISAGFGLGDDLDYSSSNKVQQRALNQTVGARTGNGKVSSTNAGYGANSGRTKVKQTVLTSLTGKEVDIQVANNTNLKGSLLAAGEYDEKGNFKDNGKLHVTTDTLTYKDSSNTQYNTNKSFNVGTSIGISESRPNKSGVKMNSSSLQFANASGYSKTKTLATIGEGNLHVNNQEDSDEIERLNRDTKKVNKELYDLKQKVSIDMTVDHRLLSEDGRKEIEKDYKELNKNMNIIAGTLPDENSDNALEATTGEAWNTLTKYLSLGLIPSNENRGGILAEIPILTGENDTAHKKLLVINELSPKFNEKDYIKMEDSNYYKALTQEDKLKFDGKGLYLSKAPVEITMKTATYQNSINGMMNNEAQAIINALQQTGQFDANGVVELAVGYNPSYGFISDLLESFVDKSGIGTTGIAKQTGKFVQDVTTERGSGGSNFAMHSQANAIVYNGIKYIQKNGGFKPVGYYKQDDTKKEDTVPTFVSFGSAMNGEDMNKLIDKDGLGYIYSGAYTKPNDFVGEAIGGNKGNNEQATLTDKLNISNVYKLFTSNSPHSTYICQDYAGDGKVKCGYRK